MHRYITTNTAAGAPGGGAPRKRMSPGNNGEGQTKQALTPKKKTGIRTKASAGQQRVRRPAPLEQLMTAASPPVTLASSSLRPVIARSPRLASGYTCAWGAWGAWGFGVHLWGWFQGLSCGCA
jgi:hypothetical protein